MQENGYARFTLDVDFVVPNVAAGSRRTSRHASANEIAVTAQIATLSLLGIQRRTATRNIGRKI